MGKREVRAGVSPAEREERMRAAREMAKELPISAVQQQLVEEVRAAHTLVVVGETGSGKTTQLPQFILSSGLLAPHQAIAVTQPRRVAAVTVAARVAEERGVGVGQEVGYSVRFEDVTSSHTRIKYLTDGMLLREALVGPCIELLRHGVVVDEGHERTVKHPALLDPLLRRYGVVVVDEAHERTVNHREAHEPLFPPPTPTCTPFREALLDPLLRRYGVVVVDEAHERTVNTDVLLGLLQQVQARRHALATGGTGAGTGGPGQKGKVVGGGREAEDGAVEGQKRQKRRRGEEGREGEADREADGQIGEAAAGTGVNTGASASAVTGTGSSEGELKLIVMSATLESRKFLEFFPAAHAVYIRGRQHPVQVLYTPAPEPDFLDAALVTVLQIHTDHPIEGTAPGQAGDILVFLTGQEDIEAMARLLQERAAKLPPGTPPLAVAPIYAALPAEQQMNVFRPAPAGCRKVVLATNIAETSVTIPGIRFVVDAGLVKARAFNCRTGVDSLVVVPVSKAQARQRSGRAGREAPGKCYRLYTEGTFEALPEAPVPEMLRCNLASVVLQLIALGVKDLLSFPFLDPPPQAAILRALEHLFSLGALTPEGSLSPQGKHMARFPLDPVFAKAILEAYRLGSAGVADDMVAAVAMLSVDSPFHTPSHAAAEAHAARKRFFCPDGDHLTLVNVLRGYLAAGSKNTEADDVANDGSNKDGSGGGGPGFGRQAKAREGRVRAWCKAHYLNGRSLKKAADVYRQLQAYCHGLSLPVVSNSTLPPSSSSALAATGTAAEAAAQRRDESVAFRRALTAAFFANAAKKQADGTYRYVRVGTCRYVRVGTCRCAHENAVIASRTLMRTPLSGAVLSGAMLSGAMLSGAMLSGAMFSGAMLSGAMLSGAMLSDALLLSPPRPCYRHHVLPAFILPASLPSHLRPHLPRALASGLQVVAIYPTSACLHY
ncbi:unnamed protein product [Closterium sp. Naga37s-1]|nr:unnamed protein product [Closterium sp. Naga37s-1]